MQFNQNINRVFWETWRAQICVKTQRPTRGRPPKDEYEEETCPTRDLLWTYSYSLLYWWWECRMLPPLCRTAWMILKVKPQVTIWLKPLPGVYPRTPKTFLHANTWMNVPRSTVITVKKKWEEPQCPSTDEQTGKTWYGHKKNKVLTVQHEHEPWKYPS